MRRLLLIRHSKSSWDKPQLDDHDRPLNKRGRHDAPLMAQRLREYAEQVDAVISSTAVRALGIAKPISQSLNTPLVPCSELYTFSAKSLWEQLQQLADDYQKVAIVSHNPAITDVANKLLKDPIDNIPTSGIVAFDIATEHWKNLNQTQCSLDYFTYPRKSYTK